MITEDYVSFETAKLLKEKGFKGAGSHFYENERIISYPNFWWRITPKQRYEAIEAPTLQMAMKWLREKYNLEIYLFHDAIQENNDWWYRIEHHSKGCGLTEHESDVIYKTYEEACEAAIKYCLENLI